MAPESPEPQEESKYPVPDFQQALSNPELLLSAIDLALLELEKRLFRYAKVGPELHERAKARLGQSLSAAQHTEGHLQVVGLGEGRPTCTRPSWNAEPRLPPGEEES
jgi:hypothetical protein